jgi:ATP-binding cassette subfamily D (ALD) protein 4
MTGPLIIYAFFVISALICKWLMTPVVPLVYSKEKAEGNFRHAHTYLRDQSESVAMLRGEENERFRLTRLLKQLVSAQLKVLKKSIWLMFATESVSYVGAILAYLIMAVPIFDGTFDDKTGAEISEEIAKNVFISIYLIYQLTQITSLSQRYELCLFGDGSCMC